MRMTYGARSAWFRARINAALTRGDARVVWSPDRGWHDRDDDAHTLARWADDGGACVHVD